MYCYRRHQKDLFFIEQFSTDVQQYDIFSNIWCSVNTFGEVPSPRCCHTANRVGDEMFVFGGMNEDIIYDDLYSLNLKTMTWSRIEVSGEHPCKRNSAASGTVLDKYIVLFGGCQGRGLFLNDTWLFDAPNRVWHKLRTENTPEPRLGHALAVIDSRIYVFGGLCGTDVTYRSETFVLDLARRLKENAAVPDKNSVPISENGATDTKTETTFSESETSRKLCSNESTATSSWTSMRFRWEGVPCHTRPPTPRIGHTMVALNGKLVLLCGDTGRGLLADCVIGDTDSDLQKLQVLKYEDELEKERLEAEIEALRKKLDLCK